MRKPRPVSTAGSPDGSGAVTVVGKPTFTGNYDLVLEVRDAGGQLAPGSGFVVGLARDLATAAREHEVRFVDNATATVWARGLEKAQFIRERIAY